MPRPRIDLHTHSTVSDGTDHPAALVEAAHRAGVDVLAITDHDTTGGWAEAAAALPPGMRLVRGAEFSCVSPTGRDERPVSVHLLGYLFDPEHPAIVAEQARLRDERVQRLERITERMAADGYPVDVESVFALGPEGTSAGRPHLARGRVAAGVVDSVDEAFASLLHNGSPYYVPRADTPVEHAIGMVAAAGGVTVFAHPLARRRGRVVEPSVIVDLAAIGLAGVEVDHPNHDPDDRALLRDLAAEHGLVATGSSDYHGTNKTTPIAAETTAVEARAPSAPSSTSRSGRCSPLRPPSAPRKPPRGWSTGTGRARASATPSRPTTTANARGAGWPPTRSTAPRAARPRWTPSAWSSGCPPRRAASSRKVASTASTGDWSGRDRGDSSCKL